MLQAGLLVLAGQKREHPRDGLKQYFRIAAFQIRRGQEIRADHLQTVPSGFVGSQH